MIDNLNRSRATKQITVCPSRHKALKHLATDKGVSLLQIADEVLAVGLATIKQRERKTASATA